MLVGASIAYAHSECPGKYGLRQPRSDLSLCQKATVCATYRYPALATAITADVSQQRYDPQLIKPFFVNANRARTDCCDEGQRLVGLIDLIALDSESVPFRRAADEAVLELLVVYRPSRLLV